MLIRCSRNDEALDALLRSPRTTPTNPDIAVKKARLRTSPVTEETDAIENPRGAGSARLPAQLVSSRRRPAMSSAGRSVRRSARLANTTPSLRRSSRLNRFWHKVVHTSAVGKWIDGVRLGVNIRPQCFRTCPDSCVMTIQSSHGRESNCAAYVRED
jgi:hypothetical protein